MGARYLTLLVLLSGCGPIGKQIRPTSSGSANAPKVDDVLVRAYVLTGWAKDAAGDPVGAKAAFDEALRLDPVSVDARVARGRFAATTDPDAARKDLELAIAKDTTRGDALWTLGSIGDTNAAAKARALNEPDAWAAGWDGTRAYADAWSRLPLQTPTQFLARSRARAQVEDHDGAVADALRAVGTETDAAAVVLAGSAVTAGRVGPSLDALLDETPQTELARVSLVTLARAADDPVRTLQALPYFPVPAGDDDPRLLLEVDALRRSGRYTEAVARADQVLARRQGWAEMLRRKAHAQLDAGKPRAASETLAEPIIGAWAPVHTLMRARALVKAGRGDEALRIVEADQWRDADSPQMSYALVIAGAASKESLVKGQDAMLRGAARLSPLVRAEAFAEASLPDRALESLSREDPTHVERAARILMDAGRTPEAIEWLTAATTKWPERVRFWTLLGRAHGRDDEYLRARAADPQDAEAILWFARKGDSSVLPDLERALERLPGDPSLLAARGALWMAQGMPMRAVVSYEAALARSPADLALRETLAALYTSLGDPIAAARANPKLEKEDDDAPRVRRDTRVRSKKSVRGSKSKRGKSASKKGKSKRRR